MDHGLAGDEVAEASSFLNRPVSSNMQPLELEDDNDSMLPPEGRAPGLRHRKSVNGHGLNGRSASFLQGIVQGVLRQNIGSQFTLRNFLILSVMVGILLIAIIAMNNSTKHDFDGIKTPAPHTNTFGGKNNPGIEHDSKPGKYQRPPMIHDEDLPVSNVGHAVQSLSGLNVENHPGHFRHDPKSSPYASTLYATNVESEQERNRLQADFDKRMAEYRSRYGQWEDPPFPGKKQQTFYHNYWYKDVPTDDFPPDAWQANPEYMKRFLTQARNHVRRVREAIYEEYGFGLLDVDPTDASKVSSIKALRKDVMGVKVGGFEVERGAAMVNGEPVRGAAYVNRAGWEGLIRKLLHAIMTEDDFYVVVAGPAGPTYEGVNLQMTQIMHFHDVMEPVLGRLGIRLISRNMGMNASTTISALGGADIYGEADIFWYVPDPSKSESNLQFDFLQKQMILSGERMPVLLTPNPVALQEETKDRAWIGNIQPGSMGCEQTDVSGNKLVLPKVVACQFVACTESAEKKGKCLNDKSYPCWIDRQMANTVSDEDLAQKPSLARGPSSQNYHRHKIEGRKLTLLVLEALDEALTRMFLSVESSQAKIFPTQSWHVGEVYGELRDVVRRGEQDREAPMSQNPACEFLLVKLDKELCHMEMHTFTEWTPRVTPKKNGLASIAPVDGYIDETAGVQQLYEWFDLLPLNFVPGDDDVDVHMVSILRADSDFRTLSQSKIGSTRDPGNRRKLWRYLANETSTNGNLWSLRAPVGFCDGSAMSWCNKVLGNDCLMGNVNFHQGGMLSRGTSDWLVLDIGEVKEGVVLLRFEWSEEFGNGMVLPDDLTFYHSTDGPDGTMTAVSGDTFLESSVSVVSDLFVYPVMINRKWSHSETLYGNVTLALRFETATADFQMLLTHVYYA